MTSYKENQVNEMIYLFNAIQELPKFPNSETDRLARDLQRDTKTVGPESVDSIVSLLETNRDRQKIMNESSAKEFMSNLIGAIGQNNMNFIDAERGNASEIMGAIDFAKNQNGYMEAFRKKTLYEIYRKRLESFVFSQQYV